MTNTTEMTARDKVLHGRLLLAAEDAKKLLYEVDVLTGNPPSGASEQERLMRDLECSLSNAARWVARLKEFVK